MQILFFLLFVVLFSLIILFFRIFDCNFISRKQLLLMFGVKIFAAFSLFIIYTKIYPDVSNADIFKYFDDGKTLVQVKNENPALFFKIMTGLDTQSPEALKVLGSMKHWFREWERSMYNDNHTIIRLNALIGLFSFGNYHIHSLIFCFMGFLGIFLMLKTMSHFEKQNMKILSITIFLLPSILIWTSGNLKEPFLFLGMGLSAFCGLKVYQNPKNVKNLLGLILGILILLSVKIYIIAFLIPSISLLFLFQKRKINPYLSALGLLFSGFILCVAIHYIKPEYSIFHSLALKQSDFIGLAKAMNAGSFINISKLDPNPLSFLMNAPEAIFNTAFRPFLWDNTQILSIIAALENIFILFLCIFAMVNRKKNISHQMIATILTFCVVLFIFIGLTTPVSGGIVRYKVPSLPLILFLCFSMIDLEKAFKNMPKIKSFLI